MDGSLIEVPLSDLENLIDEYKTRAKEMWEADVQKSWEHSARLDSKKIKWLGIGNLFNPNPSYEEALNRYVSEGRKSLTYKTQYYQARLAEADKYETILERYQGGNNKFFMSVTDFNILVDCEYSRDSWWKSSGYEIDDNGDLVE